MARPERVRRTARVEFRARPQHKALWESLVDTENLETFTDWMNAAANAYAKTMLEARQEQRQPEPPLQPSNAPAAQKRGSRRKR
jgi:hypothetical protein